MRYLRTPVLIHSTCTVLPEISSTNSSRFILFCHYKRPPLDTTPRNLNFLTFFNNCRPVPYVISISSFSRKLCIYQWSFQSKFSIDFLFHTYIKYSALFYLTVPTTATVILHFLWFLLFLLQICFIIFDTLSQNMTSTKSVCSSDNRAKYSEVRTTRICERTGPQLPGSVNWNKSFRNCQVKCKLPPKNDCRRELDHVKFYPEENRAREPTNTVFILLATTAQVSFDKNCNIIRQWTHYHN